MAVAPDGLPPPVCSPVPESDPVLRRLRSAERQLLDAVRGKTDVYVLVRTGTTVDVGQWLTNGRVWACATATDLILLAAGRAPVVQKTPYHSIRESIYNPITGEFVLAPHRELKVNRIRVSALEGYQMLAQIDQGGTTC